jgi:RNA polymerase sigma factor (TIGR02999 family)
VHDVTLLLNAVEVGDASAQGRLLALVYNELRSMAGAQMQQERAGHTLQPTALVHEAYLRLVNDRAAWKSRAQFFSAASLAMRRILVDRARSARARRPYAHVQADELTHVPAHDDGAATQAVDMLALDEALTRLEAEDGRLSRIVSMRFFAGLTVEQIAELLEMSPRTVKRDWAFARAWLLSAMGSAETQ